MQPLIGVQTYVFVTHTAMAEYVAESGGYKNNFGIVLACFILVGFLAMEIGRSPIPFRRLWLVFLLWGCIITSALSAYYTVVAIPAAIEYSKMFVMMLIIAAVANSEERIRRLLYSFAAAVGLLGSKGAINTIRTGGHAIVRGPGEGMLADRNDYALALDMGFILCFIMAQGEPLRWRRWALRLMGMGCGIASIGTQSRGGALGLAAAGALLVLFSKRKLLAIPLAALAVWAVLSYTPQEVLDRYSSIETAAETDGSAIGRLQAWETAANMIRAHPAFGVGPQNFYAVFDRFSNYEPRAPHNSYIAMAAECGLPACVTFVLLLFGTVWRLYWMRRKLLKNHQPRLANFCLTIALTLAVYMVPAMFVGRQQFDLMYNLIAVSVGLLLFSGKVLRDQATPDVVTPPTEVDEGDAALEDDLVALKGEY